MSFNAVLAATIVRWGGLLALAAVVGGFALDLLVLPPSARELDAARRRLRVWGTLAVVVLIVTTASVPHTRRRRRAASSSRAEGGRTKRSRAKLPTTTASARSPPQRTMVAARTALKDMSLTTRGLRHRMRKEKSPSVR